VTGSDDTRERSVDCVVGGDDAHQLTVMYMAV